MRIVLLALALSLTACQTNAPQAPTPIQQTQLDINRAVAGISAANRALAETTIALHQQGKIDDSTEAQIKVYSLKVAAAVQTSVAILQSGTTAQQVLAVKVAFAGLGLTPSIPDKASGVAALVSAFLGGT